MGFGLFDFSCHTVIALPQGHTDKTVVSKGK